MDPAIWPTLNASPEFWELKKRKLLEVVQDGPDVVRLRGTSWVGRAEVDGVVVSFDPKFDDALKALFGYATQSSFRVEDVPATLSDLGDLAVLLVRHLLTRGRAYFSTGGEYAYVERMEVGSVIAGRLDTPATVALRAQGLRHQAAFHRQAMTQDVEINRVLLAALRQIEILDAELPLTAADLVRSRELARLLDDARTADVLFGARERWIARARRVASGDGPPDRRDLAALCAVVLAHESFEREATSATGPRAWFLNLEMLFEEAVRRVFAAARPSGGITKASGVTPIFDLVAGYNAAPDVVFREMGLLRCIGDAKYRDWPGGAGTSMHAEVYQLLAHAKAYDASIAFLAYPGDSYEVLDFGASITGCHVWAFAFDLLDMQASANAALNAMGL